MSDWPSGRSMCRCTDTMFFQNSPYRASRQLPIPRIAAVGTSFSPLPCQAWHGYRVSNAHRVEVEVGADGSASAPLSGSAAGGRFEGLHGSAITGNRTHTSVSGAVRRNQVPRRKVGTHWGYISHIYPRTCRATGSRSTSTIGDIVGPRPPRRTTYECVHYHAHHRDLATSTHRVLGLTAERASHVRKCPRCNEASS
jgi:hypothetical protein